ncbi:MAG: alpha-galactosidase [Kiritimatiellae bacterium]|nr:alpha-galactosidase [Kiritimatiellia bacterium]
MKPNRHEFATVENWCKTALSVDGAPPFSFVYNEKRLGDLTGWKPKRETRSLSDGRTEIVLTCADPETGLEVKCVAVRFRDFPCVEWTVHLRNTGRTDTPIISDLRAIDLALQRTTAEEFVLHHAKGDCQPNGMNYEPLRTTLARGAAARFEAKDGLPSDGTMPYFNVEWDGGGLIAAIGWPGQWACAFERDERDGLRIQGGQQFTHFRLHPGEEARTPRMALLWWAGDRVRSQNLWRRWMLAHNSPHPGGKPLAPILSYSCSGLLGFSGMTESNQREFIDRCFEERLPIDTWWIDAGWYAIPKGAPWHTYGTWRPDPERFPNGLKPVMDYARSKGLKTMLWFCPDSVTPGTELHTEHRQWLLGERLFNYGNPEAWRWLMDLVDGYIAGLKLDVYRTDNDVHPLPYWMKEDAEDRQGITEIRFITGFLAFYDELRRRHPNLLIDNCCAGGRRNDIETLRRSVPLWRSDYYPAPDFPIPEQMQCQTYGLAMWVPYFGHLSGQLDPYYFRCNMFPSGGIDPDLRNRGLDYDLLRRLLGQFREVAPDLLGDFYPLLPYAQSKDVWLAWQFDRPEAGRGTIQAFRRDDCDRDTQILKLHGLDPKASYVVTDLDTRNTTVKTGSELGKDGIVLTISSKPGAAVLTYRRQAE